MSKHYEIERSGLLFVSDTRTVKANEVLSFVARERETVAIVGESGCGKSTFAKVLMGLEDSTAGAVYLGDLEVGNLPVQKRDGEVISQLQDGLPESLRHPQSQPFGGGRRLPV